MENIWKTKSLLLAMSLCLFAAGCGGGGGGGGTTPTIPVTPPPATLFLVVDSPNSDGQISTSNTFTVSGTTTTAASVTVNGVAVSVGADGRFSRSVTLSSTSTAINVVATSGSSSYTLSRTVYYDDKTFCDLVYVATDTRTGYNRIYNFNTAVTGSSRIIYDDIPGNSHSSPSISPDKRKVAFVRELANGNQNLVVVSCSGGTSITNVTASAAYRLRSPEWSNGGTMLAFASDQPGQYDIYSVPAAGGTATRLTTQTAIDDSPSWTPADDAIVYTSMRDAAGTGSSSSMNLWRIPAAGGAATQLLDSSALSLTGCSTAGTCSIRNADTGSNGIVVFQADSPCTGTGTGLVPGNVCSNVLAYSLSALSVTSITSGTNAFVTPHWNTGATSIVYQNIGTTRGIIKQLVSGSTPGTSTATGIDGSQPDN